MRARSSMVAHVSIGRDKAVTVTIPFASFFPLDSHKLMLAVKAPSSLEYKTGAHAGWLSWYSRSPTPTPEPVGLLSIIGDEILPWSRIPC